MKNISTTIFSLWYIYYLKVLINFKKQRNIYAVFFLFQHNNLVRLPGSTTHHWNNLVQLPGSTTHHWTNLVQLPGSTTHHWTNLVQLPGSTTHHWTSLLQIFIDFVMEENWFFSFFPFKSPVYFLFYIMQLFFTVHDKYWILVLFHEF